jgi:hypothetical protein
MNVAVVIVIIVIAIATIIRETQPLNQNNQLSLLAVL